MLRLYKKSYKILKKSIINFFKQDTIILKTKVCYMQGEKNKIFQNNLKAKHK